MEPGSARRRERTDLYAQILEVIKRYHGQGRVTRISYAVGMPVDRLKGALERLVALNLIHRQPYGEFVVYDLTPRGQEFLDTYWRMRAFTALLDGEAASRRP
jgi:predicted transcriptional regulator